MILTGNPHKLYILPWCFSVCTVLLLLMLQQEASSHTLDDAERLLQNITNRYNKLFRPTYNQSNPIYIYTAFDLAFIQEFDEVNEKITITAILYLEWQDELYRWNPDDYGGLDYLTVDTTKIWIPYLVNSNTADKLDKFAEDWHLVTVTHDGIVRYHLGSIFIAACPIDVKYYPWDRQWCPFYFIPLGYDTDQVVILPAKDKISTTYYSDNGAWELVDSHVGVYKENVYFEIILDRKPRFVVVNVIIPIVFMSFLNVLVFITPTESGERISYCITVLLAIAVFLTLVGDNLPKTSSPISNYSYYLLSVLVVSMCITLGTMASLWLYYRDECDRIGPFWECITRVTGCKRNKRKKKKRRQASTSTNDNNIYFDNTTHSSSETFDEHRVSDTGSFTNQNGRRQYHTDMRNRCIIYKPWDSSSHSYQNTTEYENNVGADEMSWKDVSKALDKILLIVFTLFIMLDTFFFIWTISQGQNKERANDLQ